MNIAEFLAPKAWLQDDGGPRYVQLRQRLTDNTRYFRDKLSKVGYDLLEGQTAIVPVMLYDAKLANDVANAMLEEGIYVIGFSYPVVPEGQALVVDEQRRTLLGKADTMRAQKKQISESIGLAIKGGAEPNGPQVGQLKEQSNWISAELAGMDARLAEVSAKLDDLLLRPIPRGSIRITRKSSCRAWTSG